MEAVGELHGLLQDVSKDRPRDFPASFCEPASVNLLGIRPQSTASGGTEEISGFDVHPLTLAACHEREDERDELWQGQLPVAGKVVGGVFPVWVDLFGNEAKKS
jgi:hypothetical protein